VEPSSGTPRHDYLRRLAIEAYQGNAMVHWTMTVVGRRKGWLGEHSHALWREVLLHALARYRLAAPIYCLMPDHAHVLLVGLAKESDQPQAVSFVRRYTVGMFAERNGGWQKQAYDHVLREEERGPGAFQAAAHYIAENPVRAGLVGEARAWRFSGSLVLGRPWLDWRAADFWDRWWQSFTNGSL
jgi:REP element-mobilizing transposase RayT